MSKVRTSNRTMEVKESLEEIKGFLKNDEEWIKLTEVLSICDAFSRVYSCEAPVYLKKEDIKEYF